MVDKPLPHLAHSSARLKATEHPIDGGNVRDLLTPLPDELLLQIIELSLSSSSTSDDYTVSEIQQLYRNNCKNMHQLSMMNRRFNHFMTPMLYSNFDGTAANDTSTFLRTIVTKPKLAGCVERITWECAYRSRAKPHGGDHDKY